MNTGCWKPLSLLAVAAAVLSGCTSVRVETDYDASAAFDRYQTYRLARPPEGVALSPSGDAALRDTLKRCLADRGIEEVTEGPADLDVVWHVMTQEQTSVQQYSDWGYAYGGPWPDRYGPYHMWPGAPMTYTDVNYYIEGTLIIDFVDTKTSRLAFRGIGSGEVGSPRANARKISEAVERIVRDIPSGTSSSTKE
jgi:hypothetical protein